MEWIRHYDDTLMTSYEITFQGHFMAEIFYGYLGGIGKPTGALIRLFDFQGPVVFEMEPTESVDELKEVLEQKLYILDELLSSWDLSHAGDGNRFLLSKVVDDKTLVCLVNKKQYDDKVRPFWTKGEADSLWHKKFKVYAHLSHCTIVEFLELYRNPSLPDFSGDALESYFI